MPEPAEKIPPEDDHLQDLLLNAGSALFVAASATMLTDFSRRLFNNDLDGVGVFSIVVQAVFVLAASSTFTDNGWTAICYLIERLTHRPPNKTLWRFGLSLALLVFSVPIWYLLPHQLASYYGWAGFRALASQPDVALKDFERALALDPSLQNASTDMGGAFESYYRYDDAIKAYQEGIVTNPNDLVAYNNLARVLLLQGEAMVALRITDQALTLRPFTSSPDDTETKSALLKNRATAELDLHLYSQAISDANGSASAAGDCIAGKTYDTLGQTAQAQQAWASFLKRLAASPDDAPHIDPDCTLLAKDSHEKD